MVHKAHVWLFLRANNAVNEVVSRFRWETSTEGSQQLSDSGDCGAWNQVELSAKFDGRKGLRSSHSAFDKLKEAGALIHTFSVASFDVNFEGVPGQIVNEGNVRINYESTHDMGHLRMCPDYCPTMNLLGRAFLLEFVTVFSYAFVRWPSN